MQNGGNIHQCTMHEEEIVTFCTNYNAIQYYVALCSNNGIM